jgi:imidazolonepropionase-like amidohydrolase
MRKCRELSSCGDVRLHRDRLRAWGALALATGLALAAGTATAAVTDTTDKTAATKVVAIRAGTLIDPGTGQVLHDQTILVQDGIVRAMGTDVPVPPDATRVDLSREWVAPGLMDAHTHLTLTEVLGDAPFESFYLSEASAFRALRGMHNAQVLLERGFTTIRDVGNDGEYAMIEVRRAIDKGLFAGPTVIGSGKIIAPFGGQSHAIPPERGAFWSYEYLDADTPDEVRKAVRRNLYYGAGVIKLVSDNNAYHASEEELRAAVDEAHRAGVPVAIHVYGGAPAQAAIDAGVDSIEHGFFLTDAQMAQMKSKGIFLVGTDFPRAHLDIIGTSGGIFPPPEVLAPRIIDRLRRAHQLGLRMAFGTDTVCDMPGRTRADLMFDYLSVWRAAGVPPLEILRAMTSNAAELLHVQKERGRLAVDMAADLVAMPVDPLQDIEALRGIDFVMKNGVVVRTAFKGGAP